MKENFNHGGNIFAKASIDESFDTEFGIYDLNEFLAVVSGMNKPELSLQDKHMTISAEGSKSKVKYFYSDPSVLVSPTKEVNMPEAEVTFSLSESNLTELKKMAAILKTPDLALVGTKGGDVVLKVCDKKNDTSNNFDIVVGENATADYTFYFKVENLKMISGDYDVSVSSKSISHFKNKKLLPYNLVTAGCIILDYESSDYVNSNFKDGVVKEYIFPRQFM